MGSREELPTTPGKGNLRPRSKEIGEERAMSATEAAIEALRAAQRVCVYAGAGVSAESGIPTFRGAGGLWESHRAEDLATPEAFARDPRLVWRWYAGRQRAVAAAQPNAAHRALAAMEAFYPGFLLVTQNVDDLHERAGSRRMVKLHGSVMETRCPRCGDVAPLAAPIAEEGNALPTCDRCSCLRRPNVVWFGEMLDPGLLHRAREAAAACDLLLIVGTSGVVGGGYGLIELARAGGAWLLEINPDTSVFGPDPVAPITPLRPLPHVERHLWVRAPAAAWFESTWPRVTSR